MRRKLPSLNGLKAFEAAARYLSFTRAAEVLFVSQAAISHQIKALEDQLGVVLFKRKTRALELTDAGRRLYPRMQQAFDLMEQGVQEIKAREQRHGLTISTLPSFASGWLVPRLGRFSSQYPQIQVRLDASTQLTDFLTDDVDVGIRHGLGQYPDLVTEHLMDEDLYPVCHPALAEAIDGIRDLADVTILHEDDYSQWKAWLEAVGKTGMDIQRGPIFTDGNMVIQAAMAGQGVAMARSGLCDRMLAEGRLVRLFNRRMRARFAYYLVYPRDYASRPEVQALSQWLQEEIAADLGK